jgi:hypothetical protein
MIKTFFVRWHIIVYENISEYIIIIYHKIVIYTTLLCFMRALNRGRTISKDWFFSLTYDPKSGCEEPDSNRRTPTGIGPEPIAFDLARRSSHSFSLFARRNQMP